MTFRIARRVAYGNAAAAVSERPGLSCLPRMGRVRNPVGRRQECGTGGSWRGSACGGRLRIAAIGSPPAAAPGAPPCDEYNPFAPSRTGEVTLNATDFADEDGSEILSFVETESIGKVGRNRPDDPGRDRSHRFGRAGDQHDIAVFRRAAERHQGRGFAARRTGQPVSVVLKLRQVCATHFRNTFLYY